MKREHVLVFLAALLMLNVIPVGIKAGPTEIKFYLWDDPTYRSVVETFNASQKRIFVNATYAPAADYETKLTTLLAGGADLDCYMQKRQADIFPYDRNGFIEPLDKYISRHKFDMGLIKETYKSQIRVDGRVLALPFRGAGYYTYYNKKLFAAAGLPTPTDLVKNGQWTWNKFAETAKKLSSGDGERYGAIIYTWPQITLFPAIQGGVEFITAQGALDLDPRLIDYSIKMRRGLEKAKAIMSLAEQRATRIHYSTAFYYGNAAMMVMGEWFPGYMITGRDNGLLQGFAWTDWAITRVPCNESAYVTMGNCTYNHICSRSRNKEAAFEFIAWMAGAEGAKVMATAGFLPAYVDRTVAEALSNAVPDRESAAYFMENVPKIPIYHSIYGSQIEANLNTLLDRYLATTMTEAQFEAELKQAMTNIVSSVY